jgi:cytochrome P450
VAGDALIQDTVRLRLTQSLGLVTEDLVDETIASLRDTFGEDGEWQTRQITKDIATVVARLSSRVFLGKNLCRNERWLDISKTYTIDSFIVSYIMRACPALLRPIAYWFIPQATSLRKAVRDARKLIDPEVLQRKAAVDAAHAEGKKAPKVADSLGWMYEIAKGRHDVDYVAGQLSLTMAAIHTTTLTTCAALLDICEYPDAADELRREVVDVIGKEGWTKTSLYKLRLMDSFLKEGQRVRPMALISMHRYCTRDVELSDGTVLPRGSRVVVDANYSDPEIYPEPDRFDAARFVRKREEPGQENAWQFVTTTPAHFTFGHGHHACPGRFFAANELKIALCHLLLKYDWRFVPGEGRHPPRQMEASSVVHPDTTIQFRHRTPEIDLDNL